MTEKECHGFFLRPGPSEVHHRDGFVWTQKSRPSLVGYSMSRKYHVAKCKEKCQFWSCPNPYAFLYAHVTFNNQIKQEFSGM